MDVGPGARPIGDQTTVEAVLMGGGAEQASCTASHGHEVSALVEVPAVPPVPSGVSVLPTVRAEAETACQAAFQGYVGHPLSSSNYETFAARGAKVVVADVTAPAAQSVVDEVKAAGGQAVAVVADVSKEPDAKRIVDEAIAAFGRIDVLYNNAGIMPEADHSVIDTSVEDWDRVMAVNVRGVFLGCKFAIPRMVEQGSGSIINISSFVALMGCSSPQDAYTASKGAV